MAEGEEAEEGQREKSSREGEAEEPRATGKAAWALSAAVLVGEEEQTTRGEGAPAHRGVGAVAMPESLASETWEAAASSRAAAAAPLPTLLTLSSPALTSR